MSPVVAGHASLWPLSDHHDLSLMLVDHARNTTSHLAPVSLSYISGACQTPKKCPTSHSPKLVASCHPWTVPEMPCLLRAHMRTGDSYGGPTLLVSPSSTMVPYFCGPRTPPEFPLLWCFTPQPIPHFSHTHGTLLSPSGCPHTANPSLLSGTDFWIQSLSTQPQPMHQALVSGEEVQMICLAFTLLCSPQYNFCVFSMILRSLHIS